MASLPEHSAAPYSGNRNIGVLFDLWAAMAVRQVLEPDLDDLLKMHLETLYRILQNPPAGER